MGLRKDLRPSLAQRRPAASRPTRAARARPARQVGPRRAERDRVEAPGDPGHAQARGPRGLHVDRGVADHPGPGGVGAQLGQEPPEARGVGLARGHVAGAPDAREARGDAEALEDRPAEIAGLVGEDGEGRPRERLERFRDAGIEAGRVAAAARGSTRRRAGSTSSGGRSRPAWRRLRSTRRRAPSPTKEITTSSGQGPTPGATRRRAAFVAAARSRRRVDQGAVEVEDQQAGAHPSRGPGSRGPSAARASPCPSACSVRPGGQREPEAHARGLALRGREEVGAPAVLGLGLDVGETEREGLGPGGGLADGEVGRAQRAAVARAGEIHRGAERARGEARSRAAGRASGGR